MKDFVRTFAEWFAYSIEIIGILIMGGVVLYILIYGLSNVLKGNYSVHVYQQIRQKLGHGILLGLELLVAADIIHTVAVEFSFHTVSVLGLIVIIRTFLSFSLEVELSGRWPWQKKKE